MYQTLQDDMLDYAKYGFLLYLLTWLLWMTWLLPTVIIRKKIWPHDDGNIVKKVWQNDRQMDRLDRSQSHLI